MTRRFELHLGDHDADRLRQALEPVSNVQFSAGYLEFAEAEDAAQFEQWYGRLTTFNKLIHDLARREGRPIAPYKPFDPVNLSLAILTGMPDLAAIVHEVIWRQPFPNANHRTATAAIADELGVHAGEAAFREAVTPLFKRSKELLDGSDASLSNLEAKREHQQLARDLVAAIQSIR